VAAWRVRGTVNRRVRQPRVGFIGRQLLRRSAAGLPTAALDDAWAELRALIEAAVPLSICGMPTTGAVATQSEHVAVIRAASSASVHSAQPDEFLNGEP
jgi:hypothetical protein